MAQHFKKVFQTQLILCLVLVLSHYSFSQSPEESLIKNLKWRNIGPANMIGRISDFEALDNDFTQVLVASASGGVWKSVNAGTTWEPIFDKYGSSSIGDVAFFQKDPNIIWVGTSCRRAGDLCREAHCQRQDLHRQGHRSSGSYAGGLWELDSTAEYYLISAFVQI